MIRPIPSFPAYGASEDGRIWRIEQIRAWDVVPYEVRRVVGKSGYERVWLSRLGRKQATPQSVHTLVLETFVGPRPEGMEAAHGNGNRTDNRLANLRWATKSENCLDRSKHGTCAARRNLPAPLLSKGDVEWIRAFPKRRGMFADMARRLQVNIKTVSSAYYGKNWSHVGIPIARSIAQNLGGTPKP